MILSEVQSLYAYDSQGRKTSRMDNDTWEYYIYDGMNLVADYDAYNGRITRTYSYGPGIDNIQSMTIYDEYGGSETYYYIKDLSNTVHALVNGNSEIVEYYYYDAFGNFKIMDDYYLWIPESVYGNRFLFQGREYDYDTALYYFRARWYEPETGRWLSPDPIGISGGLNLYAFCENAPVNFVDPMGENVYRVYTSWISSVGLHEAIVGDDGKGGYYLIHFIGTDLSNPDSKTSCGYYFKAKGLVSCSFGKESADKCIEKSGNEDGKWKIIEIIQTPKEVDLMMEHTASKMNKKSSFFGNYLFGNNDCRDFTSYWMNLTRLRLRNYGW